MSHVSLRKSLLVSITVVSLLPGPGPIAASPGLAAWQAAGCGQQMQAADRLRADLALDNALASRANSLADTALSTGQPPAANDIQSLAEDGLNGLSDAGDQLEQAATDAGSELESMGLQSHQTAWNRGVQQLRTARSNLRYVQRPGSGRSMGTPASAQYTGPSHRWIAEAAGAASDLQSTAANLNRIALDGNFMNVAASPGVRQGPRDRMPPPNPEPNRFQNAMRRMQAQQSRIATNVNGLNAAQAMQANQFQQARQNAADMRRAVDQAQSWSNVLNQAVALCQQAQQQQPQQQQPQQQPANTQPSGGNAGGAASGGGGGAGAILGGLGAAVAVAGGVALYQMAKVCTEPDQQLLQNHTNSCGTGNCSSCLALAEEIATYCDCVEAKGEVPGGTCGTFRSDIEDWRRMYCEAPKNYTPAVARRGGR